LRTFNSAVVVAAAIVVIAVVVFVVGTGVLKINYTGVWFLFLFSRDGYVIQRVSGTWFHFGFKVENHELILNSIFVLLAVFISCY